MKKLTYWGLAAIIVVVIATAFWWGTSLGKDLKDPLNKPDAFVYTNNGTLHWFELTLKNGKIKGKRHQQKLIETAGKAPSIDGKINPVTGETTDKGYRFFVDTGGEIMNFEAWFSGPHLAVQEQGEQEPQLYNPVNKGELDSYVDALQDYHKEENEKKQRRQFFTELRSVYGYLHTNEDGSFQLFIKIDEALLQGELSGSLLMISDKGIETRYALNGVTDGNMVRFFTTVDGKTTKLEGHFHEGVAGFDLSFWTTDKKLRFRAVTEEEYKK
jgi:hypothetical protein